MIHIIIDTLKWNLEYQRGINNYRKMRDHERKIWNTKASI